MKILHIIYDDIRNPWCGGGGAHRVSNVNEYIAQEHDVTVLTGNYPGARNESINGVNYLRVGLKSSYLLSRISFTLSIPFVIQMYPSHLVVNECSFFSPCFADLYTKRPVVNVIHHLMGKHSFRIYPKMGIFPYCSEKIFLLIVQNVITSAKEVKDDIQKKYPNMRVVNIANGVPDDLFGLEPVDMGDRPFILFLGRIDIYMKGLDILIESFSRINNREVILKIAGSGKTVDVQRLSQLVNEFKLGDRVQILGKVTERKKRELLQTCMFLVMPSRFEGWGITGVEANAAGKPVLGTRIAGLSEAVANGKTALLVEPENHQALKQSMEQLIVNDGLRTKLGKQGRIRARQYSWESISRQQFDFYETVVSR
jgi:glycosyltransferase involved in cell wall biosynthesis